MVAGSFDKFSSVTDIRFEQMNLPLPPNNHVPIVWASRGTLPFSFWGLIWPSCIQIFLHLICRSIFQFRLIGSSSYIFFFMRGFSSTMIAICFALRTKLSNLGVMRACLFTLRLLLSETKKKYRQIAGKDSARTVGASRLDELPSGVTILEALLIRTVDRSVHQSRASPTFGAVYRTF